MAVDIAGIISVVVFYLLILGVGIFVAKWRSRKSATPDSEEEVMVAGRNIGAFVGIFTMTATWVGGGYINGTAEAFYTTGLLWCQAPFGYAMSLVLGGLFFAGKMREGGYVTMLDPLQQQFGERMGGLLFIPALCGEIFWAAAILSALGATLSVIIDMEINTSVILSAFIAVAYTMIGGLYSVAYTDVIQLFCIFIGLWISIPFAWTNSAVGSLNQDHVDLIGSVKGRQWGPYMDTWLLLIFGGIPWQVYFQRVLSSKSASQARLISFVAAFGCFIMAIPPVLMGAIAQVTAWNATSYGTDPATQGTSGMVVPLVMNYLTPKVIAYFGLGAISAAVMSSADSSVLSASSMFARNVYRLIFRQKASEREIVWVMRVSIFVVGGLACVMALRVPTIYGLWTLCSDLVYVILFPQLLMVVHFKPYCNLYGSLSAYIISLFFRLGGGEPILGIPAFIFYPGYDDVEEIQYFPFRTLSMLLSLVTLTLVSVTTNWMFKSGIVGTRFDFFKCIIVNEATPKMRMTHPNNLTDSGDTKSKTVNEVTKF